MISSYWLDMAIYYLSQAAMSGELTQDEERVMNVVTQRVLDLIQRREQDARMGREDVA